MKLTVDARLIRASGIGVYLQNLIKSPLLSKFDVELLVSSSDVNYARILNKTAAIKEYDESLYSVGELIKTPFKTSTSNIFWSPHYNVPVINFASNLKIVTVHDVFHLAYYNTLNLKQKFYSKMMLRRAVHASDIVFTVSNFSKQEIINRVGGDPSKIRVIYNGVELEKFSKCYTNLEEANILKQYEIEYEYILFVGNVKPHKNLKKALEGFKYYYNSVSSSILKFLIVGKKEGFVTGDQEVQSMIEDPFFKDKVFFTGWVADEHLPLLYQKAVLFIFPSIYEGFGFPPLEAMAAGCPVISSNRACMPEVYGNAALYFDPYDAEAIGKKVYEVVSFSDLKKDLIRKGYEKCKEYSWESCIKQKVTIISQHLNDKN